MSTTNSPIVSALAKELHTTFEADLQKGFGSARELCADFEAECGDHGSESQTQEKYDRIMACVSWEDLALELFNVDKIRNEKSAIYQANQYVKSLANAFDIEY